MVFWAHSMAEELPANGLSVLFLKRVEDVSDRVKEAVGKSTGNAYNKAFEAISKEIEKEAAMDGKYVANVKEFFGGNQYLLLVYKKYKDVRFCSGTTTFVGQVWR